MFATVILDCNTDNTILLAPKPYRCNHIYFLSRYIEQQVADGLNSS